MPKPGNQVIQTLANRVDESGWIYMKEDAKVIPGQLVSANKTALGATVKDTFKPKQFIQQRSIWVHLRSIPTVS